MAKLVDTSVSEPVDGNIIALVVEAGVKSGNDIKDPPFSVNSYKKKETSTNTCGGTKEVCIITLRKFFSFW
tara:strand:- start:5219 stop:5431 length:213 start_codon:yes stop_codon:yes gene_type:complete